MNVKKILNFLVLQWAICIVISSCQTETINNARFPRNYEEIEAYYEDRLISSTPIDDNQALVKLTGESINEFWIVNFQEEKIYSLPINAEDVIFEKKVNNNELLFYVDGTNPNNVYQKFPYLMRAIKGDKEEYYLVENDLWHQIGSGIETTTGKGGIISDCIISFDSLQLIFKAKEGDEASFYAAYLDIPITHIYFGGPKEMCIVFKDTLLSVAPEADDIQHSQYIEQINLIQEKNDVIVEIRLKDGVKQYFVEKRNIDKDPPYLVIEFK